MLYQIVLKNKVIKTLQHIDEPYYSNLKEAIYNLVENPRPRGYIKLKGRNGYRIRVADYRIIHDIHDDILSIIDLGLRNDIYK